MNINYYILFGLLFCLYYDMIKCKTESITYFNTERPKIYWYDPKIFKNCSVTGRRVSRQDPKHYLDLYVDILVTVNNDMKLHFYFYQFLTNRYRPSFVEMHFGFCDMWHYDNFFGPTLRAAAKAYECPAPPGKYNLKNMTIPHVPKGFPFTKGRIYVNASNIVDGATRTVFYSSIDMEIKTARIYKN